MLSRPVAVGLAILGIALAARIALGPAVGFRSPLNAEAAFGLVAVLALASGTRNPSAAAQRLLTSRGLTSRDALLLATIPVLIAILFWRAASFGFLSDDFVLLKLASSAANYRGVFTQGGGDGFFRPLGYISLAWTSPWADSNPAAWHWTALGLHALSSLTMFVLARWLGFSGTAAWFAAALFAIHGTRPEAVVWMAGRFDVLAGLFTLISLAAFVHAWETQTWGWWIAAMAAAACGMLSKESAYALPLMLAVFAVAQPGTWARRIRFVAPVTILAVVLFAYRWILLGGIGGYLTAEGRPQALSLSILAVGKALAWRMWAAMFFPVDWALDPGTWLAPAVALYGIAWAALLWKRKSQSRLLLTALGFTVAAALPPVQQLLIGADLEKARLLYLPSAGFCLFAAAALEGVSAKVKITVVAAMLLFHAVVLEHNLNAWEYAAGRAQTVCEAAAACSNPPKGVPRTLRGVYFFANGLPECAAMRRNADTPVQSCSLHWDSEKEIMVDR